VVKPAFTEVYEQVGVQFGRQHRAGIKFVVFPNERVQFAKHAQPLFTRPHFGAFARVKNWGAARVGS
jgi:hypothetical protein